MKKYLRFISLCLTLLLAVSVFAACEPQAPAQPDTSASESAAPADSESPSAAAAEPVTIKVMTLWAEDNTENIATSIRARLAAFQEENPNVVIEEEAIGDQTAYYTKLKTLAASNDLPDIFVCKGSELSMFAQNEVVAPLNEILDADAAWRDGYIPSSFNDLTSDGKIYGIPYSMLSTHVIYYNSKLLADAGYDTFPATWADFLDLIDKLKANGVTPFALGNKEQWVANSCILSTLGDRFTGSDWFRSIVAKEGAKFTDQEFVDSLAALQGLSKAGAFNEDMNSINGDQSKTLYFNGTAAMFTDGSWAIGAMTENCPQDIYDVTEVAVFPSADGGKGNPRAMSGGSGSGLAVGVKGYAEKKDTIAALLKYVLGEDYSKDISAKGEPTAYPVSDYDTSNVSPLAIKYAEMASKLDFSPIYDSFLNPAVVSTMNEGLQELLLGTVTPEELAQRIQDEYEKN